MYKQKRAMAEKVNVETEARILEDMGIESYMIDFLMQQRQKSVIGNKWDN